MKLITRTTGAKVACSKEKVHGPEAKGNVTITGTREEVKQAKVNRIHSSGLLFDLGRINVTPTSVCRS